jgi:hypothetical protein
MRVPQRLQSVARCLVVLTGNFLNIVASSSFIDCSLVDLMSGKESNGNASPVVFARSCENAGF